MEHRWGERTRMILPVTIRHVGSRAESNGETVDVSISGGLIRTQWTPAAYEPVEVCVDGEWILAWVTRLGKNAVGVEWMGLAPTAVTHRLHVPDWPVEAPLEPPVAA